MRMTVFGKNPNFIRQSGNERTKSYKYIVFVDYPFLFFAFPPHYKIIDSFFIFMIKFKRPVKTARNIGRQYGSRNYLAVRMADTGARPASIIMENHYKFSAGFLVSNLLIAFFISSD